MMTAKQIAQAIVDNWAEEIAVKDNGIDIEVISHKVVWCARLSANGYMDCTEMTIHASEREAAEYLVETYGD
jgi:hypothetical protein